MVCRLARPTPQLRVHQAFQNFPGTAVRVGHELFPDRVAYSKIAGRFCESRMLSGLIQPPYSKSASNSASRLSNNRNVLSIGAGVVISTPAAFNVSSGNLEPPDRKNWR